MGKFKSTYLGDLRVESTHLQSGTKITTDAPTDNNGKGEAFSPTDLVATALGNCMMTIMGIKAAQMQIDLKGTEVEVEKIMGTDPRRISTIKIDFYMPKQIYSEKDKKILEAAAYSCPVAKSLHTDLRQEIAFHWE